MSFTWDDELPRGFQDADFEQREMEAIADRASALRRAGVCTHGWMQGYRPGIAASDAANLQPGQSVCLEDGCGVVFDDDAAWEHARAAAFAYGGRS